MTPSGMLLRERLLPEGFLATPEQQTMIDKIEAYDLAHVREKVLNEDLVPEEQVDEVIHEFRKYLALIALGHSGIGMISPIVDQVWHIFILFTRDYATFCNNTFGRFIHHQPATSLTPIPTDARERFIKAYSRVFGELPMVWTSGHADCSKCSGSTNCQASACCPGYAS